MGWTTTIGTLVCTCATSLALACSPGEDAGVPPLAAQGSEAASSSDAAAQIDAPPADVQSTVKVRCLVDSPPGCEGCDKGDTCVYEEMARYDCVYVVYGTDCSK